MGGEIALMAPTATSKTADVAKLAPGTLVEIKGTLRATADREILKPGLRVFQSGD